MAVLLSVVLQMSPLPGKAVFYGQGKFTVLHYLFLNKMLALLLSYDIAPEWVSSSTVATGLRVAFQNHGKKKKKSQKEKSLWIMSSAGIFHSPALLP